MEPAKLLTDLPTDALGLVLCELTLAHEIAAVAPTSRLISVAVRNAFKVRPFSDEIVTLAGHGSVWRTCVAAVADGRIITGSYDGASLVTKVWRNGACVRTIPVHDVDVECVAVLETVLPGGARFVSGSEGFVKLWTIDGALERNFEVGGSVLCVVAMPDGMHCVVGIGRERSHQVRLYHVDGTLVHAFRGHTYWVESLAVTPDGLHVISGSADRLVKVWSVATKSCLSTCIGHTKEVVTVAAMPDGQRILSGGHDESVRVHNLNGTLESTFFLHRVFNDLCALVALPDNEHALSGASDGTVKLFNVNHGAVLRTFAHRTDGLRLECLALLPDGLRFVSGSDDGSARIAYHGLAPTQELTTAQELQGRLTASTRELQATRLEVHALHGRVQKHADVSAAAIEYAQSLESALAQQPPLAP